jgi:hypothetical protein
VSDDRPLAIDMFSGLGGWAEGLIAAGWRIRAYDIEDMYAATGATMHDHYELILRDVLTIHGSEIADAQLIVSSSPCTEYSYMAMPWTRAKAKAAAIRADKTGEEMRRLNELFDAQFRIQREACEAAGRHIPMVCENVRGAQPWVGPAAGNYGSYYLFGDVPTTLPIPVNARKVPGFRFDGSGGSFQTASVGAHIKVPSEAGRRTTPGLRARFTSRDCGVEAQEGRKGASGASGASGAWFNDHKNSDVKPKDLLSMSGSKSSARKAASAKIAKIPFTLSKYIGECFHPDTAHRYELAKVRSADLFGGEK